MKDGLIEVLLQRNETGEPLEEREGFVLGSVGDEYHVRVVVHRDATTKNFPFNQKTIKVGLYVDNIDVQYWKRLDLRCDLDATEVIFWGFKQSKQDIKTFVMTTPKALSETKGRNDQKNNEEDTLGQVCIVFFEAKVTEDVFSNAVESIAISQGYHLSENKKFWQQASVVTTAGKDMNKEKFEPIVKWTNISSSPSKTIIINYHTTEMLRMMKSIEEDSGSILGKRSLTQNEVVDLTSRNDEDVHKTVKTIPDASEQDGITFVPVTKSVPLLDITGDDEVLTTVNIESSSTIFNGV